MGLLSYFSGEKNTCNCNNNRNEFIETEYKPKINEPNKFRYTIQQVKQIGKLFIAEILYPDCVNYDGIKILLLTKDPRTLDNIDPHFLKNHVVLARFEPTLEGRLAAVACAEALIDIFKYKEI